MNRRDQRLHRLTFVMALAALFTLGAPGVASALELDPVGTFAQPVFVTSDPDDPDRLFVVEKGGTITLVDHGTRRQFLDISDLVLNSGEQGLLSMAFDPGYATNGRFYVFYVTKAPAGRDRGRSADRRVPRRRVGQRRRPVDAPGDHHDSAPHQRQPQRRPAPDRPRRLPVHRDGRRRRRRRSRRERPEPGLAARQDPADRPRPARRRWRRVLDPAGQPVRRGRRRRRDLELRRAQPVALLLRPPHRRAGDRRRRPGRLGGDRLRAAASRRTAAVAPTSAGTVGRAPTSTRPPDALRAASPIPSSSTRTPTAAARSRAATSLAIPASPTTRAATSTPISARDLFTRSSRATARRRSDRRPRGGHLGRVPSSFGEDSCGRLYVASLGGTVSRIEGATPTDCTPPDTVIDSGPAQGSTITTDERHLLLPRRPRRRHRQARVQARLRALRRLQLPEDLLLPRRRLPHRLLPGRGRHRQSGPDPGDPHLHGRHHAAPDTTPPDTADRLRPRRRARRSPPTAPPSPSTATPPATPPSSGASSTPSPSPTAAPRRPSPPSPTAPTPSPSGPRTPPAIRTRHRRPAPSRSTHRRPPTQRPPTP